MREPLDHNQRPFEEDIPLPPDLELALHDVVARVLTDHYLLPKEEQSTKALLRPGREEFTDWIAEVFAEGHYLRMASGALWEVASADRTVVRGWLPHDEVLIWRHDLSPTHPYDVIQLEFGEIVEAGLVRR